MWTGLLGSVIVRYEKLRKEIKQSGKSGVIKVKIGESFLTALSPETDRLF